MSNHQRNTIYRGFSFFPPVIKYLLIINVAVYLLQSFFFKALWLGNVNIYQFYFKYFALQPIFTVPSFTSPISGHFFPWQIITYMFMHGSFTHLFFNMFALWMFGIELENLWGSKKFLFYYFLCGIGAALANLFIAPIFTSVGPTVGASGSVYGILIAFGYLFPDRHIYIYFLLPIKAKYLVILYMALEVFSVASQQETGIAHVAHLGGAVVGFVYLLITKRKTSYDIFSKYSNKYSHFYPHNFKSGSFQNDIQEDTYHKEPKTEEETTDYKKELELKDKTTQEKIDAILDKLSESGYQSLTEEEKRILFQESKKLR